MQTGVHVAGLPQPADSRALCSGEMVMEDRSIKPCAIKKVKYDTAQNMECALWELVALQAAVGLRNVVQCLGAFLSGSISDGTRRLVIITECVCPQGLLSGHKPTCALSIAAYLMSRCPP